jgi:hypothetical protein
VKYFKNSQQTEDATDHDNSYTDRERKTFQVFLRKSPRQIIAMIYR